MTRSKIKWTDSLIEKLKLLCGQGKSGNEISSEIDMPFRSVVGKAKNLGLDIQKPGPVQERPKVYTPIVHVAYGTPKKCHELNACDCRWPIGDPKHEGFHFCAAQTQPGKSYCDIHEKMSRAS